MKRKILALAEGRFSPLKSKTANAALIYTPGDTVAIIDSTKAGKTAQDVLGYGGDVPVVASVEEGIQYQPTHLLIGIAPTGGRLPEVWREWIKTAIRNNMHILSGLHTLLSDDEEFAKLALEHSVTITDWRKIPLEYEVVSKGSYRTRKAKTILTVGADCNIGKMTTMLQVYNTFLKRGLKSDFIGTGQTGIMISGKGIAVDAVISDYIAGSIEKCIDASNAEGYEYIFVEGQGALTHQGYSGVTFGLMHGTMPDAMIMCVQPTRTRDDYDLPLPDLNKLIKMHEQAIEFFHPTKVVGIGINSIGLTDDQSRLEAKRLEDLTGLPAVDTFRFGGELLADTLLKYLNQ
ncbi:MAG: DUF1611 domain-containing protein [Bacteriovoracaceae bacterium]|nr:DUF1611 domain-containing protein [Bacteroidota bacterium]